MAEFTVTVKCPHCDEEFETEVEKEPSDFASDYERRYYDDINSLAQCMPEILETISLINLRLELLVKERGRFFNKEESK